MRLNELSVEVHKLAVEKGWYETPRTPLEIHALIHSEISEATEEVRDPSVQQEMYFKQDMFDVIPEAEKDLTEEQGSTMKPEGEAVELVDALIRIADYFQHRGWDLERVVKAKMDYNKTRSHRHGGKRF